MPSILLNLSTADIAALSTANIASLTTADMAVLTTLQIGAFSAAQLHVLSTLDIRALAPGNTLIGLTADQYAALTAVRPIRVLPGDRARMSRVLRTCSWPR